MATDVRPVSESLAAIRKRLTEAPAPPSVNVPFEPDPEFAAELAAQRAKAAESRWQTAIPYRFWGARLEHFADDVAGEARAWAAVDSPGNLLIMGPVGTGKTHLACAAVRDLLVAGTVVVFAPVAEMLDGLRPGGPEDALRRFMSAGVLIVDDLGLERQTDWSAERVDMLINRRWLDDRPTIITTNLDPEALEAHVGPRTFSRLVGSGAVPLRLAGADRRRS